MLTRTGQEIEIALVDPEGCTRPLGTDEFSMLFVHRRATVAKLLRSCLAQGDVSSLRLIGAIALRQHLLRRPADVQKQALFDRLLGFRPRGYEIAFNGRRSMLSHSVEARGLIKCVFVQNQYDAVERNVRDRVVVDAGAHAGTFTLMAAMLGARKVLSFEPSRAAFDLLVRNVQASGLEAAITPLNLALGDKAETRPLYSSGDPDGRSSLGDTGGPCEEANVVRLDDFLEGTEVGFIKMDTEGWEEAVLWGARESIRRFGPVLSMAAYHKPTDPLRLREVVDSIRPGYSIRLQDFGELDMYCEVE